MPNFERFKKVDVSFDKNSVKYLVMGIASPEKSFHTTDTIVLVGSLIVMIPIYQFEFGAL